MGLLEQLTGGGEQQSSFQGFVDRYHQGSPADGISDQEAGERYSQVAGEIDPDTYQQSAHDALAKMSPDERAAYAQQLGVAADEQGVSHGWDGQSTDPAALAQMTSNVHQQSPGLLGSLLGGSGGSGGGGGGGLGGLLGGSGGGGLGGLMGGSGGGGLGGLLGGGGGLGGMLGGSGGGGGNPIMRSVLGGIAAMAAGKMMGGGRSSGGGLGSLL